MLTLLRSERLDHLLQQILQKLVLLGVGQLFAAHIHQADPKDKKEDPSYAILLAVRVRIEVDQPSHRGMR